MLLQVLARVFAAAFSSSSFSRLRELLAMQSAVEQRHDAYAAAAADDFDGDARFHTVVCLGPRLREVHHRVGADVLEERFRPPFSRRPPKSLSCRSR